MYMLCFAFITQSWQVYVLNAVPGLETGSACGYEMYTSMQKSRSNSLCIFVYFWYLLIHFQAVCSFRNLHSFMDLSHKSWTWCQVRRAFWTSWRDLFEYRPQTMQVTNQYPGTSGPTSLVFPSNFCHQESTRWWTWATCRQQCLCLNIFQVPSWSSFLVLGWRWISICLFIYLLLCS